MENHLIHDRIIIAGCGHIGANLASDLAKVSRKVIVIDIDGLALNRLGDDARIIGIEGDATDIDLLRKYGIEKAEILIAVTGNDNLNIMIAEIASVIFHVPKVIVKTCAADKSDWLLRDYGITTVGENTLLVNEFQKACSAAG